MRAGEEVARNYKKAFWIQLLVISSSTGKVRDEKL